MGIGMGNAVNGPCYLVEYPGIFQGSKATFFQLVQRFLLVCYMF